MMSERLVDEDARRVITETGLDQTLFVEAGAGTGKTSSLVRRIVNLVLDEGVPLASIAAITFTEKAAAELRYRIRDEFERARVDADPTRLARITQALEDADIAAICTLHAFAQRLLTEFPIAAGIPPRVEVLDEVQSQLAFEKRWSGFLDELLDREDVEELVLRALLLDITFNSKNRVGLRQVATAFEENWDRLDALAELHPVLKPLDFSTLTPALEQALDFSAACTDPLEDKLYAHLVDKVEPRAKLILAARSELEKLRLLKLDAKWKSSRGTKDKWPDVDSVREHLSTLEAIASDLLADASDEVLRSLSAHLARFALRSASDRTEDGRLEFHDLLVLARRLLRTDAEARAALSHRYQRLLLDEFQDTDPIQVELAVRLAAAVDAGSVPEEVDWEHLDTEPGRLFFVGDPKQSIYRFRRADIELFARAGQRFAPNGSVRLTQNFRTVAPVLDWVNDVFSHLIGAGDDPTKQPEYVPLAAMREALSGMDHRPVVLGGPHPDEKVRAAELREAEARTVAQAIAQIRDHPRQWPVFDRATEQWREPQLRDITILLPTRTSLGQLQEALDRLKIPHRADTGTLVYDTQEVRDVLNVLRSIDDPSDAVATVAALRSPLFGCSDQELLAWRRVGGHWDYRRALPDEADPEGRIADALSYLLERHRERWWLEPSALLAAILRDRKAFALGFHDHRPRDTWRRLRFVHDQARAFSEAGGGDLRSFLAWAALQGADGAKVHEPLLEEPDDDAVRIMTIHGSKGLEFEIVVVSGLTTLHRNRARPGSVLFDGEIPEVRLKKGLSTMGFDRQADLEGEMDNFEKTRLLYVACTRARDHLLVSAHHKVQPPDKAAASHGAAIWQRCERAGPELWQPFVEPIVVADGPDEQLTLPDLSDTPGAREQWAADRASLLQRAGRVHTRSATDIAQASAAIRLAEGDGELDGGDDEPGPFRRGRAGTAIGRAVHAVLQNLDFADPADLSELARIQAHVESVPWATEEVAGLVAAAMKAPIVQTAIESGRYWKELFVAVPSGDVTVEGYVDLLVETAEGLVVVDYKTDAVSSDAEIDAKLAAYRLQGATYALAVERATGRSVVDCVFVFCGAGTAVERRVTDLDDAKASVRDVVGSAPNP